MSGWLAALAALAWLGWSLAVAAALVLRRRMRLVADAEHELRGAATAIGLAAERLAAGEAPAGMTELLRLECSRMTAGLVDLAAARGAAAPPAAELDAARLAQLLGNVVANASEHGAGTVAVRCGRLGEGVTLELVNRDRARPTTLTGGGGRGRGLAIAARAARRLGGRLAVERGGGVTRTLVELPPEAAAALARVAPAGRDAAASGPAGRSAAGPGDAERERPPRAA